MNSKLIFTIIRNPYPIDQENYDQEPLSTRMSVLSRKINKEQIPIYKNFIPFSKSSKKVFRNSWQPWEDARVLELAKEHGLKWTKIATILQGRTGKQVRDRYLNVLRPDKNNGSWTKSEDNSLMSLYNKLGNRWSQIAMNIPGRTETQVKNRYHTYLKIKMKDTQNKKKIQNKKDTVSKELVNKKASKIDEISNQPSESSKLPQPLLNRNEFYSQESKLESLCKDIKLPQILIKRDDLYSQELKQEQGPLYVDLDSQDLNICKKEEFIDSETTNHEIYSQVKIEEQDSSNLAYIGNYPLNEYFLQNYYSLSQIYGYCVKFE